MTFGRLPRLAAFVFAASALLLASVSIAQQETATENRFQIRLPFAWNRTDQFQAPDFQSFFPDDPAGGKELDRLLNGELQIESAEEGLLEDFKKHLKR